MYEEQADLLIEADDFQVEGDDPSPKALALVFDEYFGYCSPGFMCLEGSSTPEPEQGSGEGFPCPAGHMCSGEDNDEGAIVPVPCDYGYYQDQEG